LFVFVFKGLLSVVPSSSERPEFPLVVVLAATAAATLTLLGVAVSVACVLRHKKRIEFLGQKMMMKSCCSRGCQKKEAEGPGGSASTSEGKINHPKKFFRKQSEKNVLA
jgi:hypothetical protein